MRELEERLKELEGRHSDLTQSYESLQLEYSSVKQELEKLRKDKNKGETTAAQGARNSSSSNKHWEEKVEILDPLLFDVSAFCFDQEDSDSHRG
jgi:AP-1-like factor